MWKKNSNFHKPVFWLITSRLKAAPTGCKMIFCLTHDVVMTSWLRHLIEIFSALLALCTKSKSKSKIFYNNKIIIIHRMTQRLKPIWIYSPVTFPSQRPVTWSFDVFFELRLNKRWSKQSWGWWFETPSRLYDVTVMWRRFPYNWSITRRENTVTDRFLLQLGQQRGALVFLWCLPKQVVKRTVKLPVIWCSCDATLAGQLSTDITHIKPGVYSIRSMLHNQCQSTCYG